MFKMFGIILSALCTLVNNLEACTAIYYSGQGRNLAACNLDWPDPVARMWFIPAGEDGYGVVYMGTDGSPAYGMNEKGLFFMGLLNSFVDASSSSGKPLLPGALHTRIMRECSNVEEVEAWLERVNLKLLERTKLFFGDARGNSLIAEGDKVYRKEGPYQICRAYITQSEPGKPESQYRIWKKADDLLKGKKVDQDLLRTALERTCINDYSRTVCSSLFDLDRGTVRLYYYQDFAHVYTFNIFEELSKGRRTVEITDLFPGNKRANQYREEIRRRKEAWKAGRTVRPGDPSRYGVYTGKYQVYMGGVPWIITVSTEQGKLYYSTSEFGKAELIPSSETGFFMVDFNGIYDVEFSGNELITRFAGEKYVAHRL